MNNGEDRATDSPEALDLVLARAEKLLAPPQEEWSVGFNIVTLSPV